MLPSLYFSKVFLVPFFSLTHNFKAVKLQKVGRGESGDRKKSCKYFSLLSSNDTLFLSILLSNMFDNISVGREGCCIVI